MSEGYFYRCDPKLNKECKKSNCYINGGECENTTYKEYALESLLKVGDYVRTEISSLNLQRIGKIKKIISEYFIHTDIGTYDKENIIKSSPNIIDLIEVGDYVNGEKVYAIGENSGDVYIRDLQEFILAKDIKSIVTKEQFESMEYKIGE